ncbi:hypothetical protein R1sor_023327 [Riccia sorocarpa]|uniref:Uncharacterized protein n=1 Tax=Riccia sorocarpa TaxID=122646 RepID=A0ABD3GP55_9MARC
MNWSQPTVGSCNPTRGDQNQVVGREEQLTAIGGKNIKKGARSVSKEELRVGAKYKYVQEVLAPERVRDRIQPGSEVRVGNPTLALGLRFGVRVEYIVLKVTADWDRPEISRTRVVAIPSVEMTYNLETTREGVGDVQGMAHQNLRPPTFEGENFLSWKKLMTLHAMREEWLDQMEGKGPKSVVADPLNARQVAAETQGVT